MENILDKKQNVTCVERRYDVSNNDFVLRANCYEYRMEWAIHSINTYEMDGTPIVEDEPTMKGVTKWDGCSSVDVEPDIHLHGLKHASQLGIMMNAVFQTGRDFGSITYEDEVQEITALLPPDFKCMNETVTNKVEPSYNEKAEAEFERRISQFPEEQQLAIRNMREQMNTDMENLADSFASRLIGEGSVLSPDKLKTALLSDLAKRGKPTTMKGKE